VRVGDGGDGIEENEREAENMDDIFSNVYCRSVQSVVSL